MEAAEAPRLYETGGFRIDTVQRVLLAADGTRIALSSRAFDLLLVFVRHPGELLDKDRLMSAVWPNTIVEENNLNQCIGALRKALGDSAGERRFLVNEPGRGYRYVAPVHTASTTARPTVVPALPGTSPHHRRWALGIALGAAIAFFWWWRTAESPALPIDRSIAVLPFENRSAAPENEYLALGIQDEILTLLTRVGDLRVVARSSTQRYAGSTATAKQIGRELGVSYLLSGSVQREGDRVRVNVTLLDAAGDRHLWASTYERSALEVFAVESEVAQAVAQALQARLTDDEQRVITRPPTANPAAYDAYLRARAYAERTTRTESEIRDAVAAFEEAVRLDPGFATAWAQLSRRHANLFSLNYDRSPERRALARAALERAEQLAPDRLEILAARGYFLFRVEGDLVAAEAIFREQEKRAPASADAASGLAQLMRELGRQDEALAYYRKILADEPQNPYRQLIVCEDYLTLREHELALQTCDRVLDLLPNDVGALVIKASIYQYRGDLGRSRALLAGLQPSPGDWRTVRAMSYQHLLDRRPAEAVVLLSDYLANPDALGVRRGTLRRWLADAQRAAGDAEAARNSYATARIELETELAHQPDNAALVAELAVVEAELGAKDRATGLASKCREIATRPRQVSALSNCAFVGARVDVVIGRPVHAVETLRESLTQRGGFPPLTRELLRLDPQWDGLRSRPDFNELL